ncbi:hypothetical protein KY343_07195 [Candidatus Woesearchaeota archaeon]|nr:hypothetical protein [Candidatus Woesearchaeota archaeon]
MRKAKSLAYEKKRAEKTWRTTKKEERKDAYKVYLKVCAKIKREMRDRRARKVAPKQVG